MLSRVRLQAVCLAVILGTSSLQPVPLDAALLTPSPLGSHVRGASPQIKTLIQRGARRSPTFKDLIERLNETDVIVYIEIKSGLPSGLDGRLTFLTAAGGLRYLHAEITNGLGFEETIAVAGHELQHAIEVASDPEVRDASGLARLYQRIGIRGFGHNTYDTAAAQDTGKRVRQEMS